MTKKTKDLLTINDYFCPEGVNPYDGVEWSLRKAQIKNDKGKVVFEQDNIEAPVFWSDTALNVVASRYFRGHIGESNREHSIKDMIDRVVNTISEWAVADNYMDIKNAKIFENQLRWLLLHQRFSYNSPVWFNLGVTSSKPQVSACFINSVEDTMESLLELQRTESMLFKFGSGTGTNFSKIRSEGERLSGGGTSSGVMSFLKGLDAWAGVVKSGGSNRRAAKMVILDVDHPDIMAFIESKVKEEKKAWALIDAGYDASFTGEAYSTIAYQNGNNSVRVTDEFMKAVEEDKDWTLFYRTDNRKVAKTLKAREIFRAMAEAAWKSGDPGVQFDTTINHWHTVKNSGRIEGSNPCSEFMFLNDTACNLASINLMNFLDENNDFNMLDYMEACRLIITSMEIFVSRASYPTERIAKNSEKFRPLGLGFCGLGAALMAQGIPYDSVEGCSFAALVESILSSEAYRRSAEIAAIKNPFDGYEENKSHMLKVMEQHAASAKQIKALSAKYLEYKNIALESWENTLALGEKYGFRNAQISVLAPTGTIAFMMDSGESTSLEPAISLVAYKTIVGGGLIKIVNRFVDRGLQALGYEKTEIKTILDYLNENDTIEGAPYLKEKDLPVFDCAFRSAKGTRSLRWEAHVNMMAAVQPFISGAISKTVNLPKESTVEDVEAAYIDAWKKGLKSIAVYRDGSKRSQPIATNIEQTTGENQTTKQVVYVNRPERRRLPSERNSLTHKFRVGDHEGYITVGLFEDGQPGEVFITIAKEGSTISGLLDAWATSLSLGLQYGVPLRNLANKFSHSRFEPSGFTGNPQIPIAKSVIDYVVRWMALHWLEPEDHEALGIHVQNKMPDENEDMEISYSEDETTTKEMTVNNPSPVINPSPKEYYKEAFVNQEDAPSCSMCGSIMVRSGSCYKCNNCGATSGCS